MEIGNKINTTLGNGEIFHIEQNNGVKRYGVYFSRYRIKYFWSDELKKITIK